LEQTKKNNDELISKLKQGTEQGSGNIDEIMQLKKELNEEKMKTFEFDKIKQELETEKKNKEEITKLKKELDEEKKNKEIINNLKKDLEEEKKNRDVIDKLNKELEEEKKNRDELAKLKKELENLKNAHGETIIKVNNNKEQIDLIIGRLNDIIKGYKDGDEKLQKEIDDLNKKLSKIHSQIDLLLKMPRGTGGGGDDKMDMSALNELMKKIIDLENDYKDFVERVNIDEIYRQLKFLHETKADKKDLNSINNKIDDLNDKYESHQIEIEAIKKRIDGIYSQLLQRKDEGSTQPIVNIDFSQYLSKTDFEKHRKENEQEFKKIWEEIERL
jgi:epidermal growth factor receptor substrate 15